MPSATARFIKQNSLLIEETLWAFGIRVHVVEAVEIKGFTYYSLDIAMGTAIDDIIMRKDDIALSLAVTGGTVEILAPEPGRPYVGLLVRKPENLPISPAIQKYKIIRIKEIHYVTYDHIQQIRSATAIIFRYIAYLLQRAANKIDSSVKVSWDDKPTKKTK